MLPPRYFPPRYFPSRYWARTDAAVDPNALHGAAHGLASTSAGLHGIGALAATISSVATVQGDLTASGTAIVGTLTGTAHGASTTSAPLVDGAALPLVPMSGGAVRMRLPDRQRIAGTSLGRATPLATLTGSGGLTGTVTGTHTTAALLHGSGSLTGRSFGASRALGQVTARPKYTRQQVARARREDELWLLAA